MNQPAHPLRFSFLLLAAVTILGGLLGGGCRKPKPAAGEVATPPPVSPTKLDPAPAPPVVTPERSAAIQSVNLAPLREGITKYQQQFKQNPYTLADLVQAGILKKLPPLPAGTYIQYDRTTASVKVVAQ